VKLGREGAVMVKAPEPSQARVRVAGAEEMAGKLEGRFPTLTTALPL
jgi:hypothetical protein